MIKVTFDNGETYTEKEFKRDYVRMMDSLRKGTEDIGQKNCSSVSCEKCPLYEKTCFIDSESYGEQSDYMCLETVKIVHDWAKEHPVKTNLDKLEEVFGIEVECVDINNKGGKTVSQKIKVSNENDGFNACYFPNYDSLEFSMFETLKKWLDEEYKEPHKETGKEND